MAFVLIEAHVGRVREIIEGLKHVRGVVEAYGVTGPHDIVVKIQLDRFEDIAETVTHKIHKLEGVKNTLTMFTFEKASKTT